MPSDFQNTNYQGAVISNQLAAALKAHPIGRELLRFDTQGKQTVMQVRLPEMGHYVPNRGKQSDPAMEGKEFNIRVNMNYLVRGLARACMDKNGNIDPNKLSNLADLAIDLSDGLEGDKTEAFNSFVDQLGIPPEKRESFEDFLRANGVGSESVQSLLMDGGTGPVHKMLTEVRDHMLKYQAAINGEISPEARQYAEQEREQFENTMQSYREMADMDPETETRILFPMDCIAFSELTNHFIRQNNAYRRAHGMEEYQVDLNQLDLSDQKKAAQQAGKEILYDKHHFLSADLELPTVDENGLPETKRFTLSLEATAPAYGKLFHRPELVSTGVGVFPDRDAIEKYHRERNVQELPDEKLYESVLMHKVKRFGQPLPILKASQERSYRRYCRLHTGSSVNRLPESKLAEYAAKVTAAAFLGRKLGPQGKFDLDLVHTYAEALQRSVNFKAAVQAVGPDRLRAALHNGSVSEVADLMIGGRARYGVDQKTKQKFADLAAAMETKGRNEEWKTLKRALENREMTDSSAVFDAVEKYLKGKKSVRRDQKGKDSVDLALRAVAIAANSGDDTAIQRARILVDRINTVRKTGPGYRHYVDLDKYLEDAKGQPNKAPAEKDEILQHGPEENNSLKTGESLLPAEHGRQSVEPGSGIAAQMSN